ncbi:AI-2E family transporter [Microbacterium sp. NPDC055357]
MTDASDAATPPPASPTPAGSVAAPPAADVPAEAILTTSGEAPASRSYWTTLNRPFIAGFFLALGALAAFAVGVAFTNLSTVLIYIVFALFAALGLDPIVRWLEKHSVKRSWGIVIVYTGFAILMAGVLLLIVPTVIRQIAQFVSDVPSLIADFQKSDFYHSLQDNFGDQVGTILNQVQSFITNPSNIATIGGGLLQVGASIATTISGLVIVLVLSLYFLASLPTMKKAFNRVFAARNRPKAAGLTEEITDSIGGYLMGMVILAFCNSILALVLHLVLGLPFPALMAVVAFCITLIPLVGSVLYWALATVIALFTGWLPALLFAAIYLVYMQLEAYVLTPRVMNRTISVPGSLVVIGALVGGTLLGLLGALVAIPVTASILLIIKQILIPRQDAKL